MSQLKVGLFYSSQKNIVISKTQQLMGKNQTQQPMATVMLAKS
jgi:hypothetical protein